MFNYSLDRPLFRLHQHAQKKKWGIPVTQDGVTVYYSVVAFADNYWILATSPTEARAILQFWLECIEMHGWRTPLEEITYCTTAQDSDFAGPLEIGGYRIKRSPRKTGFKALGTFITFDNQFDVELTRRISAAWGAFCKFAKLLKCQEIPFGERCKMLARGVHPALFWCSGSWNLRKDQLQRLRGVQNSMLRKMLKFTRGSGESIGDFMHRTEGIIKNLKAKHDITSWDLLVHRSAFRWAGRLVQISLDDPGRLTAILFNFKDSAWLKRIEAENDGRQLHGRILRVWRWESAFFKSFGVKWKETAADRGHWDSLENWYLNWRLAQ